MKHKPSVQRPNASSPSIAKSWDRQMSEIAISPAVRHSQLAGRAATAMFHGHECALADTTEIMARTCGDVHKGNLALQKSILACQATTLDTIFTHMAEMALNNLGEHPEAAGRYLRLALKAQSNCKATIEAIDRMAREGIQTVKHVYVDNRGGQTVISDMIATGGQHEKNKEQCHARLTDQPTDAGLLSYDTQGNGVPIPSCERETAVQDARRN